MNNSVESSTQQGINQLEQFFSRWRNEFPDNQRVEAQSFILRSKSFLDTFIKVKEQQETISLTVAPAFNIFHLMKVTRNEISNSAFIANLLDPSGTHGQGTLFVLAFLRYFIDKYHLHLQVEAGEDLSHWKVHTEQTFAGGRCDIVIMNASQGILAVIENKVDAGEQDDQLLRYNNWMQSEPHLMEYPQQFLFFLTTTGYKSGTLREDKYFTLSYRQDICNWLQRTLPEIQAPGVKEVVQQYIYAISHL
jgi:hypothetical protein